MKRHHCELLLILFCIYPVEGVAVTFSELEGRGSLFNGNHTISFLNGNASTITPKDNISNELLMKKQSFLPVDIVKQTDLLFKQTFKESSNVSYYSESNIKNPTRKSSVNISTNEAPSYFPGNAELKNAIISRQLLSTDKASHITSLFTGDRATVRQNILLYFQEKISLMRRETSLQVLLTSLIKKYMEECNLIIGVTSNFRHSRTLDSIAKTNNLKQVMFLDSNDNPTENIIWEPLRCQGTLLLLSDLIFWNEFGNNSPFLWDYGARVLVAGLSAESLREFIYAKKARKTEHIVGVVKREDKEGHYRIFINNLFSRGAGLSQVSSWGGASFRNNINLFPNKVSNLEGMTLNVVVFEWTPAIIYHRDSNGNVLLRYGRDVAVVENLARTFKFTINYVEPSLDELWGERLPNGSYNGMVGLLERGEGDLAIANLFVSALDGRRDYQDYSAPFSDDQGCYFARVDPPLPRWHSPALPFQLTTWAFLFIGLLFFGPMLYFLAFIGNESEQEEFGSVTPSRLSLFTFGIHFSQPMATLPIFSSTRVFVAFLWIYSIILTTGYKSNLTAFFTITRQPASIETTKGLAESGIHIIGLPFWKELFEKSENEYIKALHSRFEIKMQFSEIADDVRAGRAVGMVSKRFLQFASAQMVTTRGRPLVRILKECISSNVVSIGIQRNSPLKPSFDKLTARMFESGLVNKWFFHSIDLYMQLRKQGRGEQKVYESTASEGETSEGVTSLSLDHLQGVFVILAFGCVFSLILFTFEICAH